MSMENAKGLCPCLTERFEKSFLADSHAVAMKNAAAKHNMKELAAVPEAARLNRYHFSNVVKTRDITHQKNSGRCWILAGMNLLREIVAEKLNLERFELSQNYIAFWDKYEKVNFFYEAMIDLAGRDLDDRTVCFLNQGGIADGGQWDMLVNVIEKYGVVPKDAMPETCQSSMTSAMNGLMNTQMRRNALILRAAVRSGQDPQPLKEKMMEETYRLLCIGFSVPPKTFDFEVTDKDGKYICDCNLTPKQFYDKYIGINWDDYVSVINSPTADKPFNATYTLPTSITSSADVRSCTSTPTSPPSRASAPGRSAPESWSGSAPTAVSGGTLCPACSTTLPMITTPPTVCRSGCPRRIC